jgi:hypothetical protein
MVRIGSLAEGISVKDPHQCAAFLTTSFDQLAEELADHHIMARQDAHFRIRLNRKTEAGGSSKPEAAVVKFEKIAAKAGGKVKEGRGALGAPKICSGHFGKQLAAVKKDGRPYHCGFEKTCTYANVSIAGMSAERILEIATGMPRSMKLDFIRAINSKKK